MGISNYALDTFVAQDMSKLTQLGVNSLAAELPSADSWLATFVLRRILHAHMPDDKAALAFAILRRAHAALQEWELASAASKGDVRSVATYFTVLRHVEACLSAVWQGLEFARKSLGQSFFTKGDGSVYERMNWMYNVSRHFDPQALQPGDMHRVWLSDHAIHTREQMLAFDELRESVRILVRISDRLGGKREG